MDKLIIVGFLPKDFECVCAELPSGSYLIVDDSTIMMIEFKWKQLHHPVIVRFDHNKVDLDTDTENTVFEDGLDMVQARYACWWGDDFTGDNKLELHSFNHFTDDIGYNDESRDMIANLHVKDVTQGDWPENHYIMRVK